MSNVETSLPTPTVGSPLNDDAVLDEGVNGDGTPAETRSSPPAVTAGQSKIENGVGVAEAPSTKSDSEAETIVLPGKEEEIGNRGKMIKHESESANSVEEDIKTQNAVASREVKDKALDGIAVNRGKRKRTKHSNVESTILEGGNSSALSSVQSSPAHGVQFSKEGDSDSDGSRSSPPHVSKERIESVQLGPRKRKLDEEASENDGGRRRTRRQESVEFTVNNDRRETRSATHQPARHTSQERSQSPHSRSHRRTLSTQTTLPHAPNGNKKRKPPPPLLSMHERTQSEDRQSDSSSASGSPHPFSYLRRIASGDTNVMSPAKTPHKKHRDQNGRTWLARACAALEMDNARARLKERPEDLNIEDNAGNTPLQIASLEGCAPIVRLLLEAGCDVDCKNIDRDTPLIDAVENGHLEVVQLLLNAGANPRQGNAKGEDPLDLLNSDKDNYEAIKQALLSAKERDARRRQSEDQGGHTSAVKESGTSSRGASAASPRESPPVHATRSPPPASGIAPRRRTVRSEVTRNDLLWMKPTPENLRDRAGKGDMAGVGTILNVLPQADTESLIAAARGGHDEVIQLLLGMGNADADPYPLQSATYKPGYNTPMLAAIGRGNEKVIQLLLTQPNFDPLRRDHRGLAYYEIAKERQGFAWEKEFDILKQAFDKQVSKGRRSRKSDLDSPRKPREKANVSRRNSLTESSTVKSHKVIVRGPQFSTHEDLSKGSNSSKDAKREASDRLRQVPPKTYKHLEIPESNSREHSVAVSDRESTPLAPPRSKVKPNRSQSDAATVLEVETAKPRRKLVSGKVLKNDQERKRRASNVSTASSSSSSLGKDHIISDKFGTQHPKAKREDSQPRSTVVRAENPQDQQRSSASPHRSPSHDAFTRKTSVGGPIKKKRRTVDSDGNEIVKKPMTDQVTQPRPAQVANMVRASETSVTPNKSVFPPTYNLERANDKTPELEDDENPSERLEEGLHGDEEPHAAVHAGEEEAEQRRLEREREDQILREQTEELARREAAAEEERLAAEAQREREARAAQAAQAEVNRLAQVARDEKEARLEEERRLVEAERQTRIALEEEEARMEKKRQEEEIQRRRAEQERLKREEQERRRAEQEERERVLMNQRQEEEERCRRQALPNSLCRAAELNANDAKSTREITKWLPLFTVTNSQLDPTCEEDVANDRWIPSFQAAPILAIKDLELSQCKLTLSPAG